MNNYLEAENEILEGVAIIGMDGRFPGANNLEQFWHNLRNGVESITFFSDEELIAAGVAKETVADLNYVKAGAILSDVDLFDADFFGIPPREAQATDPQHRLLLECAWGALESSGHDSENYDGRIGVYVGASLSTYLHKNLLTNPNFLKSTGDLQIEIGNDKDFVPTRISYKLNLTGPSVSINTACSTSLVSVHIACQGLLDRECDLALAGGATISIPQTAGYFHQEDSIASPDGHCRPFDAQAQGTIFGSGVGVVVLKRLEDAIADRDPILAVIKGSAINNDGSLKVGYTAPSVDGQAEAIAEAQEIGEIDPETISYIENHGTGTAVGDPIEIAALTKVFRNSTERKGYCAIGSVKGNLGHLNRASGVIGLIKTVLALKNQEIPPSINYQQPNPQIDFVNSPFYVNTDLKPWQTNGLPRRAGVSSFGIGGTNAHIVLEEAPVTEPSSNSRPWQLILLSAKNEPALATACKNLAQHLETHPDLNLGDVAYTLQVGRRDFDQRRIVVCQNSSEACQALQSNDFPKPPECKKRTVAFMFSGQGAQYVNMGKELYESESIFREQIDYCCDLLQPILDVDLRDVIYPAADKIAAATEQLTQTRYTQPALFIIEYALARLWMAWGIKPEATIGHSIGEYVAACLAGVFSLDDALVLVAERGKLMQELPSGSMLSVFLPETEVKALLNDNLDLAVVNAPDSCVVSGTDAAIDTLELQLQQKSIDCRRLHTSHAFHSSMMEPILASFREKVSHFTLNPPQIPYISNVTGTWITPEAATSPDYWAQHLRATVSFAAGVKELLQKRDCILLEVGAGRMLKSLALKQSSEQVVLSSLRHPKEQTSDLAFLLNTLGQLWQAGVSVDWAGFYQQEKRDRLALPTYPFQRQSYWVEPQVSLGQLAPDNIAALLPKLAGTGKFTAQELQLLPKLLETLSQTKLTTKESNSIADWFYQVQWQPKPQPNLQLPGQTKAIAERIKSELSQSLTQPSLKVYGQAVNHLEALSAAYVVEALQDLGWKFSLGQKFDTALMAKQLGIIEQHHRLLNRLLEMLVEENILRPINSEWEVISIPAIKETGAYCQELFVQYPTAEAELTLLSRCGSKLAPVLQGKCDPLPLLFPEADVSTAARLYQHSPWAQVMNNLIQKAVLTLLEKLPQGDKLRILEIGGGTGGTTSYLLPHLDQERTEYLFTDISPLFITKAKAKFRDYPAVRYQTLNIELSLAEQGFDLHQYDLIVASNVLHATQDLRQTMQQVRQLLRTNGTILLLEGTRPVRWLDLIFGLLDGWQRFTDLDLRPDYPLISAAKWQKLLKSTGFTAIETITAESEPERISLCHQSAIFAQGAELDAPKTVSKSKNWLILADMQGIGQNLATLLEAKGEVCTLVFSGARYEQLAERKFQLNPNSDQDFEQLLPALDLENSAPLTIVNLWSLDGVATSAMTLADLVESTVLGCRSTLNLVQYLVNAGISDSCSLWLVTRGAQAVGTQQHLSGLAQSPLWGLGKVIDSEHPELNCIRVDLDPELGGDDAQALFREICLNDRGRRSQASPAFERRGTCDPENQLAFRDQTRYVPRLSRKELPTIPTQPKNLFQEHSTYLITGGLQGLGLYLAEWMAEQGAKHLVLLARSAASESTKEKITQLQAAGVELMIAQADVTQKEQVVQVLKTIEHDLPPLAGIFHAAGVVDDGVLQQLSWSKFSRVMAPKVQGTWNLHQLTQDMSLDFFVLFSSVASLLGFPGQANHVSGNTFLDTLTYYRHSQGLSGLTINWGLWAEIGSAVDKRIEGIESIPPQLALSALKQLLSQSAPQVGVAPIDWQEFGHKFLLGNTSPFLEQLISPQQISPQQPETSKQISAQDIKQASSGDRNFLLIAYIQERVAHALGISTNQLDKQQPLTNMGLDSLMAVQLRNLFKTDLGVDLRTSQFMDNVSVNSLAEVFSDQLSLNSEPQAVSVNSLVTEDDDLIEGEI